MKSPSLFRVLIISVFILQFQGYCQAQWVNYFDTAGLFFNPAEVTSIWEDEGNLYYQMNVRNNKPAAYIGNLTSNELTKLDSFYISRVKKYPDGRTFALANRVRTNEFIFLSIDLGIPLTVFKFDPGIKHNRVSFENFNFDVLNNKVHIIIGYNPGLFVIPSQYYIAYDMTEQKILREHEYFDFTFLRNNPFLMLNDTTLVTVDEDEAIRLVNIQDSIPVTIKQSNWLKANHYQISFHGDLLMKNDKIFISAWLAPQRWQMVPGPILLEINTELDVTNYAIGDVESYPDQTQTPLKSWLFIENEEIHWMCVRDYKGSSPNGKSSINYYRTLLDFSKTTTNSYSFDRELELYGAANMYNSTVCVFGAFLDEESSNLWDITDPFIFFLSSKPTANRNFSESQLRVYPNPASDHISVDLPEAIKSAQIEILNVNGALILNSEVGIGNARIDISKLSKGVYIIRLRQENSILVTKFIKQ